MMVRHRYSSNARAAARQSGLSLVNDLTGFTRHNRANNAGDVVRFYLFNLVQPGTERTQSAPGVVYDNRETLLSCVMLMCTQPSPTGSR